MTRLEKVLYLTTKGEEIVYEKKGSHTYILGIKNDNGWETFTKKHSDQKRAGDLIDVLYFEWTMIV